MFEIKKTFEVAIAHRLDLPYESKCSRFHGHNLVITVYCTSDELNENGMVIDFTEIKKLIEDKIDHFYLNEVEGIGFAISSVGPLHTRTEKNPTAERLAEWICMQIDSCYKVEVQESIGNVATYTDDSVRG